MIQPIKQTDVNPSEKVLDEAVGIKQKEAQVSFKRFDLSVDLFKPL
jgi:hypothetical protein